MSVKGPAAQADDGRHGPRIFLYSHDSWGLGHLRRNLNLASALSRRFPEASLLLCTGSACATAFPLPPRTEVIKLPSITKNAAGEYVPRQWRLSAGTVSRLRRSLLSEAVRQFDPQVLIVDHQVVGLLGELVPVLRYARENGIRTVLGIRDVVDAPDAVARQWAASEVQWALDHAYDRLCVYGVPEVFDPRWEYRLSPQLRSRVEFTGYVVPPRRPATKRNFSPVKKVLLSVGGGEDGIDRVHRYLHALKLRRVTWKSTVVTGPLMPLPEVQWVKRCAEKLGDIRVFRFHADLPHLLDDSDLVVCMAGYNMSAEALQSRKPVIFLPRTWPRTEQLIRAQRLARLGLCQFLVDPTPGELRRAVEDALEEAPQLGNSVDLGGRERVCDVVSSLLAKPALEHSPTAAGAAS